TVANRRPHAVRGIFVRRDFAEGKSLRSFGLILENGAEAAGINAHAARYHCALIDAREFENGGEKVHHMHHRSAFASRADNVWTVDEHGHPHPAFVEGSFAVRIPGRLNDISGGAIVTDENNVR